jgi:hypothetical protein
VCKIPITKDDPHGDREESNGTGRPQISQS